MSYDPERAGAYWNDRVDRAGPMRAVVGLTTSPATNAGFDAWEKFLLYRWLPGELAGKTVVDLGAGIGRHSAALARRGAEVVLVDVSDRMLATAQQNFVNQKLVGTFLHGSVTQLNIGAQYADAVLALGLLEHLPPDAVTETLSEVHRVLKPNGRLIVSVNNAASRFLKTDNPYRQGRQLENGYFNRLTPFDEVAGQLRLRFEFLDDRSNLMYSWLRHHVGRQNRPWYWHAMELAAQADARWHWPPRAVWHWADHVVTLWRRS